MADEEWDMSGNTQQFQAFARRGEGEPASGGLSLGLIVGGAVVLVVVIAVVALLVI
jgi:hypothetical protein